MASNPSTGSETASSSGGSEILSAYRLISFLCGARFVAVITSTPKIQVIRLVACALRLPKNGLGASLFKGMFLPQEACNNASVDSAFSSAILVLAVIDAFGGMISSGLINHYAGRYGRKPIMRSLMILNTLSTGCIAMALRADGALQNFMLLMHVLLGALCGPTAFGLVFSMCVVDTTEPDRKTSVLVLADGFATIATAPAYWLGGHLSSQLGIAVVFDLKIIAIIPIILYVEVFILETLPSEKRKNGPQSENCDTPPTSSNTSVLKELLNAMTSLFVSLRLLRLSQETIPAGGPRPLIIATSQFLNTLGSNYVGNAFVTYATVKFQMGSDQLAVALSGFAVAQGVWLWVVVLVVLPCGRPHEHSQNQPEGQVGDRAGRRFDVYFAVTSSALAALASTFLGLAKSLNAIVAAYILFSLGTGHDPTTYSIMDASVDSMYSDQALSALTIVKSMGELLTPIIVGSALTLSISHFPEIVFFMCSATIVSGGVLLTQALEE